MSLYHLLYEANTPNGTPITKQIKTETNTEDRVIIECIHIPVAPMKANNIAVIVANLNPTVT